MKHAYLSVDGISDALTHRAITQVEAEKLMKKIDCQATIYKTLNK